MNPISRSVRHAAAILCISVLALKYSAGQTETATISGQVHDPSGAAVRNASLTLVDVDRDLSVQTTSNHSGIYIFQSVKPGHYRIAVQHDGFKTADITGITVNTQDTLEENLRLDIGSASESVTVDASGLNMNTTDGSVSTVVDRQFVENMPLNGRSFQDLISLTPGVVTQSPQSQSVLGANGDFSVNGQRTESNSYIVDGISANTGAGTGNGITGPGTSGSLATTTALGTTQSLLSVDALQEFRVETSTYSAEHGRTPGGQFSFSSRSGTRNLHGTLFDYFRNNFFDANDWFNDHYGQQIPALRQNDFGGAISGPVRIPGQAKREADTFFFLSYEGLRLAQPTAAAPLYVPSSSLRGAASSTLQPILNAFPLPTGAELDIACDDVTFPCADGQPLGTLVPSGLSPFIKAYSLPSRIDSTSLRLDHAVGSRTNAFIRAAYTPSSSNGRALSNVYVQRSSQQTYTAGVDTQISDTLNNQLRVGLARSISEAVDKIDNFAGAAPINLAQGIGAGAYPRAASYFTLILNGIGLTSLETATPANYQQQWNVTDSVGWTAGHHSFKVGVDYRRITSPYTYAGDPLIDPVYLSLPSVINNVADLTVIERARPSKPVYNQFAIFGQDEWSVTSALNLSLGLRWEVDPAPYSANGNKPYSLMGDPNNPSTYSLGAPGTSLYRTTWHNIAPRLGAAWKVHAKEGAETIVRCGFGIFYDTGASATSSPFEAGPGVLSLADSPGLSLPLTPAQLDLSFAVEPPYDSVYAVSSSFQLPYTVEWSAALEQAFGKKQNLTLSYVAANGRRLVKYSPIQAGLLNPEFTYVLLEENGLTSNYQSLQVQFQRQFSHGLQALSSYVWSHNLDYGSEDNSLGYKRGNSDLDLRSNFTSALSWEIPFRGGKPLARLLLGGWATDLRLSLRTGFPVPLQGDTFYDPVTGTQQNSGLNVAPGVPFYIHNSSLPGGRAISSAAFTSAPANTLGNAPRNFLRGFGQEQLNLAIRRDFPLLEGTRLQFRAETFNVLNHPNFGYVDPTLTDATFGQATSTLAQSLGTVSPLYQQGGARSMQLAVKVLF